MFVFSSCQIKQIMMSVSHTMCQVFWLFLRNF